MRRTSASRTYRTRQLKVPAIQKPRLLPVAHANRSQDPRRQAQSLRPGAVLPALLTAVPTAVPPTNASGGRKANPRVA